MPCDDVKMVRAFWAGDQTGVLNALMIQSLWYRMSQQEREEAVRAIHQGVEPQAGKDEGEAAETPGTGDSS